jgi:hypothetical protein
VVLVSYGNTSIFSLTLLRVVLNAIWRLAATLGARSSFKKLPKRDVMGADIIQLCGLITEPAEPLALRLSSNLMVGVARYVFICVCYGPRQISISPSVYKGKDIPARGLSHRMG